MEPPRFNSGTRVCARVWLLWMAHLCARGVEHRIVVPPGGSVQAAVDRVAPGGTVLLEDGWHAGPVRITRPLTLRAVNPGNATLGNAYRGEVFWRRESEEANVWVAEGIDWRVVRMTVDGLHAYDYRTPDNFHAREGGPYWSKGFQEKRRPYATPPISFAWEAHGNRLWLRLHDDRDPNRADIRFHKGGLEGRTLVQKDLGNADNQQEIVTVRPGMEEEIPFDYGGMPGEPGTRMIRYPAVCGVVVSIESDDVAVEGLRIDMAPTTGVEVNDSSGVSIRDCVFTGYQFAVNTGYRCTRLTVEHCEMDGGRMVEFGGHDSPFFNMWNHSTYVIPVKFNGTGLVFRHNYVYEGFDLFHPRGRHKAFPDVPDLPSDVAYNVWQNAVDNAIEFDGVEARTTLRFHHNLVLQNFDALAITTTENGGPLTIDHNLWWPGGGRVMKLTGTGRVNRGVRFLHNTFFTGGRASSNRFEDSLFLNNLVLSPCDAPGTWTPESLGAFFPDPANLLLDGGRYTVGFAGLTVDPRLGRSPETLFLLQEGSPAIDAGEFREDLPHDGVRDGRPDLGALEFGATLDGWAREFGRPGPRWVVDAAEQTPNRPWWPSAVDPRWGGFTKADVPVGESTAPHAPR